MTQATALPAPAMPSRVPVTWPAASQMASWAAGATLSCVALAIAWWLIRPQLGKPYAYDEAAFAFAGRAVAQTGLPYSNVGHLQTETPGDFSKRFNWALWHPPLYVYALGYAFRLWGEAEPVARLVGVICNAVVALLVFVTGTLILAERTRAAAIYAALGAGLYVTNPLVIQSALLLDIDGTVLVASVALVTLVFVLLLRSTRPLHHPRTWALMGLAACCFALSLWAKMTTSLAVLAAAALYRVVVTRPWQPWRAAVEAPVAGLGGVALFLATWWLTCVATGMPFWFPFRILALELSDAAGSTEAWREHPRLLLEMISYVALWISPYFMLLFIWAALARLRDIGVTPLVHFGRQLARVSSGHYRRTRMAHLLSTPDSLSPQTALSHTAPVVVRQTAPRLAEVGDAFDEAGAPWTVWPMDFVLLTGGAIGAVYLIKLAASFPKYHITMMPLWAIGAAYVLYRFVPRLSWWEIPGYGVTLAGMAGYFTRFVGDQYVLFRGWDFVLPLLVWPAALGLVFLMLGAVLGKQQVPRQLAILSVLLTLSWSWGVSLAQSQATYSTAYNYGTAGQKETAAYLDSILKPEEAYVAAREVAYYAHEQTFVDQDTWWEHIARLGQRGIGEFDGQIAGYRVNVVALFMWDPTLGQIAHSYLDPLHEVSYQSGAFVVFVRTSP